MLFRDIAPFARYVRLQVLKQNTVFPVRVAPDARFFYTLSGAGTIRVGDTAYPMERGSVLILAPGTTYHLLTPPDGVTYFAVNFDYTGAYRDMTRAIPPVPAEEYTGDCLATEPFSDLPAFDRTVYLTGQYALEPLCADAQREFARRLHFGDRMADAVLTQLLLLCARQVKTPDSGKTGETAETIIRYLHEHYAEPLTNRAVGARFSFHPNYVNELIRRSTGLPLHRYLLHIRIRRAMEWLESSDLPVGEIATLCGFPSLHYFSRYFKQETGLPPTAYRRK